MFKPGLIISQDRPHINPKLHPNKWAKGDLSFLKVSAKVRSVCIGLYRIQAELAASNTIGPGYIQNLYVVLPQGSPLTKGETEFYCR